MSDNRNVPQRGAKKSKDSAPARGKKKKQRKSKIRRIIGIILALIIALCLAGCVYCASVIMKAPKIDPNNIYTDLNQSSVLYDDEGNELDTIYAGDGNNRINVKYSQIPEDMINAIVAVEDKTFWKHHGFNFIRILGAVKESIFNQSQVSGTSTITQQLARNIYLTSERSMARKIKEAYYTVCLEHQLTKEEIIEAYLNTVNFGYGCYGIQAAAQGYFHKDVEKLKLSECIALASIPQSPAHNALILRYEKGTVDSGDKNIITTDNTWIYYYNGKSSKARRTVIADFMLEQGYIDQERHDKALKVNLKKRLKVTKSDTTTFASYFTDYVIDEVIDDFVAQGMTEQAATEYVYNGGLKIYTTLSADAQKIVEKEYSKSYNFPTTANVRFDANGNIVNNYGSIQMYRYSNYFDSKGNFTLRKGEYKKKKDGSMILYKNRRLNFYPTTDAEGNPDYNIEFKNMYVYEDGLLHEIEGGVLSIDSKYKTLTEKGNMKISKEFFKDHKNFFKKTDEGRVVKPANYVLRQKINQPQSAMVILDNKTSQIKAMIGGRGTSGNLLYNRSTSPRQPGSSIKPLAVYSSALQQGADSAKDGKYQNFTYMYEKASKKKDEEKDATIIHKPNTSTYGKWWTANSYIYDGEMTVNGQTWPKNWYTGYKGYMTMRKAVEQSVNVCAVKVFAEVGPDYAIKQLKKFGITSVVEDGDVNDKNAAALALGGMTRGVSPLQMAGAYATLAHGGKYTQPTAYTQVTDREDKVVLETQQEEHRVISKSVAWITSDILRTTVTNGIANQAAIGVQPVAGKTGTTSDNFDAWFCGFTPQYTAALWIGNDVNIELSEGSASAARLWSKIMGQVCSKFPYKNFKSAPSSVSSAYGEYFVRGTEQATSAPKDKVKKKKEKKKEEAKEEESDDNTEGDDSGGDDDFGDSGDTDDDGGDSGDAEAEE